MLFKDVLEKNFKNQKQVTYYAKEMLISEKRLNQATSKLFGKTPKEIIDDRIMLEAKRILAHTHESVKKKFAFIWDLKSRLILSNILKNMPQ